MRKLINILALSIGLLAGPAAFGYVVHVVQQVEVDGVVVETIDATHDAPVTLTTSNAVPRSGYIFTEWTTSAKQDFPSRDDWGRAFEQVSFTVYEPMTNTAHYVREDLDSDNDGMPDGRELYWYGNLDQTPESDTDGDGIGFARELELGLNPHFADDWRRGLMNVSARPQFFTLLVRSEPEGLLFATVSNNVAPGVHWTSTAYCPSSSEFAYWIVNGVAVLTRDEFGRALDSVTFTMPGNDVEVIAVCAENVETRASLYWYGDESIGWESDTDDDGLTLREEFAIGTNPLFKDVYRGGVKTAARNPQFFKYTLRCEPEGTLFATVTENVAPGVGKVTATYDPTSSKFAYWRVTGLSGGSERRDDFGRALDWISFEMPTNDVEVVAVCCDEEASRQSLYWYGDETHGWTSDTDGDGLTFREEVSLGFNPLFADAYERGILCASRKPQFFKYTLRSDPEGVLFATTVEDVCPGVIKTTASYTPNTTKFAYWTFSGVGGISGRDDFGRALDAITLEMPTNDVELIAHCVDDDEVRQSLYWYGDETTGYSSDTDGDGYTLKEELALGLNPLFADVYERGIMSAATSFELFTCIIRSEPEGVLFATQKLNIGPGVPVTTPTCDEKSTDFASWYLNGVRQADDFGRAWNTFTFVMPPTNTEAVAMTVSTASERDSLYWYGERSVSPESDTDGDGFTLAEEMSQGTNPLFADTNLLTGVRYALSEELEVDLQPFEQMRGTIVDGEYVELFTSPLAGNEETSATFGPEACPLAVDVDGDGLFDLVVASAGELRVFINKGSAANPDFSEIDTASGAWANFAKLIAGMVRPIVVGANGVYYVSDGGGEIYQFTLSDGAVVTTGLRGIPGVFDGRLIALNDEGELVCADAGYTMVLDTPVLDGVSLSCADIDADGRTDILVSDYFGHIWLYRNTTTRTIKTEQFFTLQYKVWAGTGVGFADGIAISLVDWEDDGDYDVVLGTEWGKLMLLRDPRTGRPTNVRAYPGVDNVLLEWDPNSQPRIRGYNVYRAPDAASYVRIVNQTPLPTYRDFPKVLQDYWYQITGVSRFYIAGNSTPTVNESMPTDAVYVQFCPSVWLNDTSSFTDTNVEMIVSMNNSMGISTDGFSMTFEYDAEVLEAVSVKSMGLSSDMTFDYTRTREGARGTIVVTATGGEIKNGSGMFLGLMFYVKPVKGVSETTVSITAATVKAKDGRTVVLELPKSGKIEICEPEPPAPAIVSVNVADAAVESETSFELPVTVTATEKITNFVAEVLYDKTLLRFDGWTGSVLRDNLALKFYALDPASSVTNFATTVMLTNIVVVDINEYEIPVAKASGTVLIKNSHPWVPGVVSVATEDKKVDTLAEVVIPFRVTSSETLVSGAFSVEWDDGVLELVRVEGGSSSAVVRSEDAASIVISATGDFTMTFLAKDQHTIKKTLVRMTSGSVVDVHGFTILPAMPVVSTILIHDAHPLIPAKVSLSLGDVKVKTETEFDMTLTITTTEALTALRMSIDYDDDLLELRSGELEYSGTVPSSVTFRFYAKENHEVKSSDVTITPISGTDHNGLAAEFSGDAVGKVVFEDSNPWQPATVGVNVGGAKVDTMTEFEQPVTITSSQKLTNFVATVTWDDDVLEYTGENPLRFDGAVPDGFMLKFYARDQHSVTKTSVGLSGMSAVDEHGLVANPIADAIGTVLIHDAHPLIPAKVSLSLGDVKVKTETEFDMTLTITTTEALTALRMSIDYDDDLLELRSGELEYSGTVPSSVTFRFYAKENHEVKSSDVTITPISGTDHNGLAAEFSGNAVGKVVFEDSNPWKPATVGVNVGGAKVDTMTEFELPVTITSSQKLTNFVATVTWDDDVLEYMGDNPLRFDGAVPDGFKLKFYARDQHSVTKTSVGLTGMSAVDEHGLVANPIADAIGTVLIHDAHPLIPAKVSLSLGDVKVKTETEFDMTLTITTTEALTALKMSIDYDDDLLELRSGELEYSGAVPSAVTFRFYAKENHEVKSSDVTITPISGTDHNGLAAEFSGDAVGKVVLEDSNPWKPATVGVNVGGAKVDTMTEFEQPVTITSSQKLTNFVATVTWDDDVLEYTGENPLRFDGAVPDGFMLKFYARDQHTVTKTSVGLSGMSAVDEHGLVANPIADAIGTVLIHDAHPLIPAEVAIKAGDASVKTKARFTVPVTITSTKTLTNLNVRCAWDSDVFGFEGAVGAIVSSQSESAAVLSCAGSVPATVMMTFYAKEQHTVKSSTITLSDGAAVCTDALAAHVSCSDGKVTITDSNPPVAPTMVMSALDVRAESGKAFVVNVGAESVGGLSQIVFTLEWDSTGMTFVGCEEPATIETLSANSRRFTFAATGTDNRYHLNFMAASITGLKASSWAKVTAASATGDNGLAAQLKTALPITVNVLIVREISKYDPGDINGDGKYTDADLDLLNKYIAYLNVLKTGNKQAIAAVQKYKLTGKALKAADVNCDGVVDANDISMLAQYIAAAKEAAK